MVALTSPPIQFSSSIIKNEKILRSKV